MSKHTTMTEPKTCRTCHWWFLVDHTDKMGVCVFHTGMQGVPKAKTKLNGPLETAPDFGCNCWEENRRDDVDTAEGNR